MYKFYKILCTIGLFFVILLTMGCEIINMERNNRNAYFSNNAASARNSALLWNRLTNNFQISYPTNHKHVKHYINKYKTVSHHITQVTRHASPYLFHVAQEVESRKLPAELALLPGIESAFKPFSISNKKASGIWQLNRITGKHFSLPHDQWYDARFDIEVSTAAALDYLEYLYKKFGNDWLLALAAYNAGPARIQSAIRRNKRLGKPTTYWDLSLPKQTAHFVPKLLAFVHIIKNAQQMNVKLHPIENKPYFTSVAIGTQMDLNTVATLAEVEIAEIKRLNPGYKTRLTHPNGPHKLLLPIKHAKTFTTNLANKEVPALVACDTVIMYTVQKGDSLSLIAQKYQTSILDIKTKNQLTSDTIIIGKKLHIPIKTRLS